VKTGGSTPTGIRTGLVAATLVLTAGLIAGALQLGPFIAAGADTHDPTQRIYAANVWQEVQTSLALLAVFLPWLMYGLLFKGSAWGGRILVLVGALGTIGGTWLTVVALAGYAALPRDVSGVVGRIDARALSLRGGPAVYLVVSDAQLAAARSWLKPGASVTMWVSPRGQAGFIGPAAATD
jgi:hypothetical protein